MIHKKTHSYMVDLVKDDYFGEIGFFTDNRRLMSAKSRDFTEVYAIYKKDFLEIAEDYIHVIVNKYLIITLVIISLNKKCSTDGRKLLCVENLMLHLWQERAHIS